MQFVDEDTIASEQENPEEKTPTTRNQEEKRVKAMGVAMSQDARRARSPEVEKMADPHPSRARPSQG